MSNGTRNVHVLNRLAFLKAAKQGADSSARATHQIVCSFSYPDEKIPLGSGHVDRLVDESCMSSYSTVGSSLRAMGWLMDLGNYARPEEGKSHAAVLREMNSWMELSEQVVKERVEPVISLDSNTKCSSRACGLYVAPIHKIMSCCLSGWYASPGVLRFVLEYYLNQCFEHPGKRLSTGFNKDPFSAAGLKFERSTF